MQNDRSVFMDTKEIFRKYGGVFGAQIKMRPVKGKLPLGWLCTEIAFARKQEEELAGARW